MKLRVSTNRYFQTVSQFAFIKEIGVGSFGSVKLALHIQTNKCYAVKIVDISSQTHENELLLLEREINLHTKIDHPHIIKLWDTLIEGNIVYMIMELAQNGTLFSYQNKHRIINEAQTFKFFSQSLSAIRYMHMHDMMHRDIKPENILLDSACNVKICDLGWATDNIQIKRKTFCGTYEYMAPEMVFEKEYNFSIDTWALGILIYELLHGYAPFPAKDLQQMRQKVKRGYYQLGSSLSLQLKNLIIEILQFDPSMRPSTDKIISHPWMQKMRREIKNEIGKIQSELRGQISKRAKVQRQKGSQMNTKKHKRFDSLMNDNYVQKSNYQSPKVLEFTSHFQRLMGDQKKKFKKKCKTQGEESIEKMFTQTGKTFGVIGDSSSSKLKWKKEKQNSTQTKYESTKANTLAFKNQSTVNLKMRKIADKLNQLTNKYPNQKKKTRLKAQKQQLI